MLVCELLLLAGKLCKWSSSKMVKKIQYLNLTWLESSHFLSLSFLLQHPQEVDEERLLEPTYFFHKAYLFFLCVFKKNHHHQILLLYLFLLYLLFILFSFLIWTNNSSFLNYLLKYLVCLKNYSGLFFIFFTTSLPSTHIC